MRKNKHIMIPNTSSIPTQVVLRKCKKMGIFKTPVKIQGNTRSTRSCVITVRERVSFNKLENVKHTSKSTEILYFTADELIGYVNRILTKEEEAFKKMKKNKKK